MRFLVALVKAILEWATELIRGEIKKDVKAGDADDVPQSIRARWRQRIDDQLRKH